MLLRCSWVFCKTPDPKWLEFLTDARLLHHLTGQASMIQVWSLVQFLLELFDSLIFDKITVIDFSDYRIFRSVDLQPLVHDLNVNWRSNTWSY